LAPPGRPNLPDAWQKWKDDNITTYTPFHAPKIIYSTIPDRSGFSAAVPHCMVDSGIVCLGLYSPWFDEPFRWLAEGTAL